jgi:hypothetical protein
MPSYRLRRLAARAVARRRRFYGRINNRRLRGTWTPGSAYRAYTGRSRLPPYRTRRASYRVMHPRSRRFNY